MKVKIDTKEKFHVITIQEQSLAANMTEQITQKLLSFLDDTIKNVIVNLDAVSEIEHTIAEVFVTIQQTFYEQNSSFVICNLQPSVKSFLDKEELLELLNVAPTESEAWDIVQMEEIEREFSD